jgi:hypothetical protein
MSGAGWPSSEGFLLRSTAVHEADGDEVHNLGDLVAQLAAVMLEQTWLGDLDGDLTEVVERMEGLHLLGTDLRAVWRAGIAEAARIGFALGQTVAASADGWPAWASAATLQRMRTGCTEDSHVDQVLLEIGRRRRDRKQAREPGGERKPAA